MTDAAFEDCIAIDTNVFIHLFDSTWNTDSHINKLLEHFQQGIELIVDDSGRIAGEYDHQITPRIRSSDDTRNEIYILRYWMEVVPRRKVGLDNGDRLMQEIRDVVVELSENVDRIFVYVAFKTGKILITNDLMHIVEGPDTESTPRRQRLLRSTRRLRHRDADILTSREAYDGICA